MARNIAVLVGSLRRESFNRKMALALLKIAPDTLKFEILEIGKLPFYNEDDDQGNPPEPWAEFRNKVKPFDGVLFVTPEYNRSVPAVLKNAIDVGSRPYGKSVWDGKPAAVISVSPGKIGGFGANHHLRQSLVFLNMPAMPAPEAYIGGASDLFDAAGEITKENTLKLLRNFMTSFAAWIELHAVKTSEAKAS